MSSEKNITYRVELARRARQDLARLYPTINAGSSPLAATWFNSLERLILALAEHPARGPIIRENLGQRHLLHGRKPHVYRVIYQIDESARVVTVRQVRHSARDGI